MKSTVEELDQLLNANAFGDPIKREGATFITIVSYGFGDVEISARNRKIQPKQALMATSKAKADDA